MQFSVPSSTSVGSHSYKVVWVDNGLLLGSVTLTTGTLMVHDAYEKVYLQLLPSVQAKLNDANSANYKSPDARSDASQAQTDYGQATSLANQGQFQQANGRLNSASSLLNQAAAAEQSYVSNPATLGGNPELWYLIAIVLVVIVLAAALLVRRRRHV